MGDDLRIISHAFWNVLGLQMHTNILYEIEFPEGLKSVVEAELGSYKGRIHLQEWIGATTAHVVVSDPTTTLLNLKSITNVFRLLQYPVPRPKALLGHQHLQLLLRTIQECMAYSDPSQFRTLYIGAAGSDSTVMQRIRDEILSHYKLQNGIDEGDLLVRIRPSLRSRGGWDVLIRLTTRPLSARKWRVCNLQGALSANVAHAMMVLSRPQPSDVYLNIGCGSATLLIERAEYQTARLLIGTDIDPEALLCARQNLTAYNASLPVQLLQSDMRQMPFPDHSMDVISADLPFGQLVGSHTTNLTLYPAMLDEVARVARDRARFVIITHEIRLMARLLAHNQHWTIQSQTMVNLTGLHPRIYVLERNSR
jgi:tRNA (guanine6-N2)-methyltransferase